jgi:RNA polymerase sigma factor (TIGR02999 family)
MSSENESPTGLLTAWRAGDAEAGNRLFAMSYGQLRKLAAARLRFEAPNHTLQPTALVNELYLRLFASEPLQYQDRAHFLAIAAESLRRILIDHGRKKKRVRRGGSRVRVTLSEAIPAPEDTIDLTVDFVEMDEALQELALIDPRVSRVIELRFFAGLTEKEAAEVLDISLTTLKRDWTYGRAWLHRRLNS